MLLQPLQGITCVGEQNGLLAVVVEFVLIGADGGFGLLLIQLRTQAAQGFAQAQADGGADVGLGGRRPAEAVERVLHALHDLGGGIG